MIQKTFNNDDEVISYFFRNIDKLDEIPIPFQKESIYIAIIKSLSIYHPYPNLLAKIPQDYHTSSIIKEAVKHSRENINALTEEQINDNFDMLNENVGIYHDFRNTQIYEILTQQQKEKVQQKALLDNWGNLKFKDWTYKNAQFAVDNCQYRIKIRIPSEFRCFFWEKLIQAGAISYANEDEIDLGEVETKTSYGNLMAKVGRPKLNRTQVKRIFEIEHLWDFPPNLYDRDIAEHAIKQNPYNFNEIPGYLVPQLSQETLKILVNEHPYYLGKIEENGQCVTPELCNIAVKRGGATFIPQRFNTISR